MHLREVLQWFEEVQLIINPENMESTRWNFWPTSRYNWNKSIKICVIQRHPSTNVQEKNQTLFVFISFPRRSNHSNFHISYPTGNRPSDTSIKDYTTQSDNNAIPFARTLTSSYKWRLNSWCCRCSASLDRQLTFFSNLLRLGIALSTTSDMLEASSHDHKPLIYAFQKSAKNNSTGLSLSSLPIYVT